MTEELRTFLLIPSDGKCEYYSVRLLRVEKGYQVEEFVFYDNWASGGGSTHFDKRIDADKAFKEECAKLHKRHVLDVMEKRRLARTGGGDGK